MTKQEHTDSWDRLVRESESRMCVRAGMEE